MGRVTRSGDVVQGANIVRTGRPLSGQIVGALHRKPGAGGADAGPLQAHREVRADPGMAVQPLLSSPTPRLSSASKRRHSPCNLRCAPADKGPNPHPSRSALIHEHFNRVSPGPVAGRSRIPVR